MGTSPRPHLHRPSPSLTKKFTLLAISILLPLGFIHFYLFPLPINAINPKNETKKTPISSRLVGIIREIENKCDYADGRWVQSERGPLYNGTSCGTIKQGQNCMAHGRPDTGYLYWRWQPKACNLRPFDPVTFLGLIRNKHLAFVGDSLARNQLESLLCLLSAAATAPELVYRSGDDDRFRRWVFGSYNATVSVFWSPFLVKGTEKSPEMGRIHNELHLDATDDKWASEFDRMDFVVFAIGHWFLLPAFYYESGELLGCHHCPGFNDTKEIGFFDVFRKAIKTTLKEVVRRQYGSDVSNKHVIVTTFSPAHFEGEWDKAGACAKKEPYKEGEKEMEYMDTEMRKIEVEEVAKAAEEVVREKKVRLEALDVTKLALMRPDGHPGPYMNPNPFVDGLKDRVPNDCVHWCMPGPIDTWNEILMEKMMRWEEESR